jgi:lysophospholipase L1-like esterase
MFSLNRTRLSHLALAAGAVLAAASPGHAESPPGTAHFVAPAPIPAAATSTAPPATPAMQAKPAQAPASPPLTCSAPAALLQLHDPLVRTARALAAGEPLTIVALGSSSTAGAGASSPAMNYPSQLEAYLKKRFPDAPITVLNRGVNGEETPDMMARFEAGVFAAHPQLVLWQVGTNSVLRDQPLKSHSVLLHEGIEQLKTAGLDVVLIDPQFAPKVLAKSETPDMVEQIAATAKDENIDLFHRFAVMRYWHETQHIPFEGFVSADGLHMSDWGYGCWAKLLGSALAEAATRPIASAAARRPH